LLEVELATVPGHAGIDAGGGLRLSTPFLYTTP